MTLLTVVGITKRIIDIDNCRHLRNNMLWSYPIIIDTKKKDHVILYYVSLIPKPLKFHNIKYLDTSKILNLDF